MENNIQRITEYTGIQNLEDRRQSIVNSKKESISNTLSFPEQHNYSGDSILIQVDSEGNWESDYFPIGK